MVNCPKCGKEMDEKIGLIPLNHTVNISELKPRKNRGRNHTHTYYECVGCNKIYRIAQVLQEFQMQQ